MLTSYNGQPVTYDAMGNITSLSGETYTWTAGRQLSRITKADNSYVDYFYDDNGQMSYFNVYEDNMLAGTYNYLWDNTKLVGVQVTEYEADENNNPAETKSIISRIIYDSDGEPLGYLLEDSVPYLYIKNILGDITGIVDGETGKLMLEYVYDAYGNMSIKTPNNSLDEALAAIFVLMYNPLTYRGYTFAPALGYNYYLGSRFYIPQLCRFMNADIYADTTQGVVGTNMFAYCNNSPIILIDPEGYFPRFVQKFIKAINIMVAWIKNSQKPTKETIKANLSPFIDNFISIVEHAYKNSSGEYEDRNFYCIRLHLISDKEANKYLSAIPTNKEFSDFSEKLYFNYKNAKALTLEYLAEYISLSFEEKIGRAFLFNEDCIAEELDAHINAYFWAIGYTGMSFPAFFYAYAITQGTPKEVLKKRCGITDIYEGDIYNAMQRIVFNYSVGIHSDYLNTNCDPYYYDYGDGTGERRNKFRDDWKMIE